MTRCPEDAALERLIADALPADEQYAIDEHLSGCARCQGRIDDLAGISALNGVLAGAAVAGESDNLRRAIRCLQAATGSGDDTRAGAETTGNPALPELLP